MTLSDCGAYVSDVPYLRDFKPGLAPAWLDHVALVCGIRPPARRTGFAWGEFGCGQGVTAAVLAATHPEGEFHALDLMPAHIAHAQALAEAAGIGNLRLHTADFGAAAGLGLPAFDYIVAHGVYTWIDESARRALRRLIDRQLKPGGLVYVSYNAMPGWARDLPVQYLLRALAREGAGDSAARASAAAEFVRALAAGRAPVWKASFVAAEMLQRPQEYGAAYLVHEFLHAGWQPLYVTELRAQMAEIGLEPVGSALLLENFDDLLVSEADRARLAEIADPDLRELVRDYLIDQRFRCDVFHRGSRRLAAPERTAGLAASGFALARPAAAIRYAVTTPRGRVNYDSASARAVVAALAAGPRRLAELGTGHLPALLRLCAAGEAVPAEPRRVAVGRLNDAMLRRLDGPEEIAWLALPCGTAIEPGHRLLRGLRDGALLDGEFPGWREFLAAHGV